jgi:signal transduction histidine kinase
MTQRVLCIEGDASTRVVVRRLLEASGIAVEESATGMDGIARARSSTPDLVIADTRLPDIEGLELAARLKQDHALAEIPFVAVGYTAADHDVAIAAGCDGFIAQPIDESRFVEQVRAYLAGKRERSPAGVETGARQRLAEMDRRGSAFMQDLAHELSTPLTPLAGYLKILQAGRLGEVPAQQRRVIDGMAAAVAKLTRIVENLSDFASLQSGQSAITSSAVDPDAIAEEVVNEVRAAARDARLHLELTPSGVGPVLADPRKLRQALANLLQNAVKFSPHGGGILVEVSLDSSRLRYSIYDQGPGVPAAELERIFEPLRHSERREDARSPGSGLGLPVARRIAEAHGGRVLVESPPHTQPVGAAHPYTGCKFVLEIPAEPGAAAPRD